MPSLLLYHLPPTPLSTTIKIRSHPKPSSLVQGSTQTPLCITCARSQDDYHATLDALNSKGRTPRKSLGQHYMLNSSINEQLADTADIRDGDVILEIGPGTGSLTNVLLDAGATVLAIEKDAHMAALVRERFADTDRLKVLQEDFMKCHIRPHLFSLLQSKKAMNKESRYAKVVSNIPFNISTDVVKILLPMGDIFSEVVLLLQDETALRLVEASLRTHEYRPINIFVNFYSVCDFPFQILNTNLRSLGQIFSPNLMLIQHSMENERCCGDHFSTYAHPSRLKRLSEMLAFQLHRDPKSLP
ncbi:ribosomal RNA small subunit methyltransferase, chloroplastic isoform X3 [Vitis riparia]|uniref:ribosomal RNA small subunit methyltransferase, chloroplastic isoform X3 n=1 Tax=Vitis riparia TaxID=96939 RepID=UPI00155A28AA|nr:ribosomal RNA small subunit methyltransferase, chloroplastic isoform X3 [Vitis riparia]